MIRTEKQVSYTYKVIDEKYTKPTDLEQNVNRFITKMLTELLPVAKKTRPKDILLKLKQEYDKYKEQAAMKRQTKRASGEEKKRNQDEEFCSIFKKLRLSSDGDTPVTDNRVTHAPQCKKFNSDAQESRRSKNTVSLRKESSKQGDVKSKRVDLANDKETQTGTPPKATSFIFATPDNLICPNNVGNTTSVNGHLKSSKLRCFSDKVERVSSAIPKLVKSCPKESREGKTVLPKRARTLNSPGEKASPPSKIPRKKNDVFNYRRHSLAVSKRLSDVFPPIADDGRGLSKIPRLSLPASPR